MITYQIFDLASVKYKKHTASHSSHALASPVEMSRASEVQQGRGVLLVRHHDHVEPTVLWNR